MADAPTVLKSLDLDGVAEFILSGRCKNIAFLTGAGMSVGAGIPDFRSPGGLYDTLKPELLTATSQEKAEMKANPTAVVSWDIFRANQFPYLEVRRPFILGTAELKWKATIAHWFVRLCHEKGLLRTIYTQNIDGLDYQVGVPQEKINPVHGTIRKYGCEGCDADYPDEEFREILKKNIKDIYGIDNTAPKESSPILCLKCNQSLIKPRTVLYGRNIPTKFWDCCKADFPNNVDLLIVAGTSLTVGPANGVVSLVGHKTVRLVVNMEPVGQFLGIKYGPDSVRDVFVGGSCDNGFLTLIKKLGWFDDLKKFEEKMAEKSKELLKS